MGNLRVIEGKDGKPPELGAAEYIWPDQAGYMHSRVRPIEVYEEVPRIERWVGRFPMSGEDVILHPGQYCPDPFRGQPSFMVLCEAMTAKGVPHETNTRATLRDYLHAAKDKPTFADWFDLSFELRFDQEPTAAGYRFVEKFVGACVDAGIMVIGATYYELSPVWSLCIGRRGVAIDPSEDIERVLTVCDHVQIARAFFDKAARENDVLVEHRPGAVYIGGSRDKLVEVLAPLRVHWQAELKTEGIEIQTKPLFDPYTLTVRLMTNLRAMERNE